MNIRKMLLQLTRSQKRLLLVLVDLFIILGVLWGSFKLENKTLAVINDNSWSVFLLAIIISIPVFIRMGLYRAVIKYFRSQAIIVIMMATLFSTMVWVGVVSLISTESLTFSAVLVYWLGIFTLITITRIIAQHWLYNRSKNRVTAKTKRVLIYGAGVVGTQLAIILKNDPNYSLAGFIDDDASLKGWNILGLNVYSAKKIRKLVDDESVDEIILAMSAISRNMRQKILDQLESLPVSVRSIPAFADLANGKLRSSDIKDIDIDDLLGRDVIEPNEKLLPASIRNKVVMVTGAGGSIGSELCRQILALSPKKLILLEQSEFALYEIEQELEGIIQETGQKVELDKILGSISNLTLLKRLFKNKTIQTIYHAAAYKHVPLVEENPIAGLTNNVFGTKLLAEQAQKADVETFILISTDKAVRPTNVMGCSKRVAELVLQGLSENSNSKTIFTMVRFGNVLGSSGSVVPKFRRQILEGGPITVTHKDITRFFMSIPEAVQLVIQAGAMAKGGEVFVLDMGKSVKISDLAIRMIKLAGLTVKDENHLDGDIEIQYSGLRPGEKLYEELLIGENVAGTQHKRIMMATEIHIKWSELLQHLNKLQEAMLTENSVEIKNQLATFVDGYTPWIKKNKDQDIIDMTNKVINISDRIADIS